MSSSLLRAMSIILLGVSLLIMVFGSTFHLIDRWQPVNTVNLGPLGQGYEVEQVILAPEDDLARIDLHLDKNTISTEGDIDVALYEFAGQDSTADASPAGGDQLSMRMDSVALADINSFEMQRFEFQPIIDDSAGRLFVVSVSADGVSGDGLTLRASSDDVYDQGELFFKGEELAGDLNFAIYHEAGIGGLADRVEPFRPPLIGHGWFFIGCLLLAGACFFGLILMMVGWFAVGVEGKADDGFNA